MKAHWILAAAFVLGLVAAPVLAEEAKEAKGPRRKRMHSRFHRRRTMQHRGLPAELELGEQQKKKVAELREAAMEKVRAADSSEKKREILGQLRKDVRSILTKEQVEKLDKSRNRRGPGLGLTESQREKIAAIRKQAREDIRKVLTKEQLKKMDGLRKKMDGFRKRMGEFRKKMGESRKRMGERSRQRKGRGL